MALLQEGDIIETRILLSGFIPFGTELRAALKQAGKPAIAHVGDQEFLLPDGAAGFTEGQALTIEVTREAIPGAEPWKRPLAKVADGARRSADLPVGEALPLPSPEDRLEQAGWSDFMDEARSGVIRFEGGELRVAVTPAMTLIDVDGTLPADRLAVRAAEASARAIRRHSIGGSIGIDFPTVAGKAQRSMIDRAIDACLPPPFERTATNGFGFLQIVRPRRYASTFELAQDRAAFEARAFLRRLAFDAPGAKRLVAHPALIAQLENRPDWMEALAGQIGGAITLRADPSLPIHGAYAEKA
jgi:ribonuclease G